MTPRIIRRRRRDGLVEIRRVRARDVVLTSDAFVLLGMLGGFFFFAALLVIVLVFDPPFLAIALWGVVAAAVEHRASQREPRIAEAHLTPPPGSAA
jgi:hypothetical protein